MSATTGAAGDIAHAVPDLIDRLAGLSDTSTLPALIAHAELGGACALIGTVPSRGRRPAPNHRFGGRGRSCRMEPDERVSGKGLSAPSTKPKAYRPGFAE
ncbi:MAG: hypothetical protein ACLGJC_14725 [Alphaproteobacteria bacterium]